MPLVWTTDKIIIVNDVKYRLKTPIEIELRGRSMGDIDIVIPYMDKDTGYEGNYYFPNEGNLDKEIIECIHRNSYDTFFKEHLEAIPTVEEICIRVGCDKQGETYFVCNYGKSKFPICFEHYDELTELVSKL